MAKVKEREELERRLARRIGKVHAAALKELLDLLGDPPVWERLPQSFWEGAGRRCEGAIGPIMEEIYILQAETMLEDFGGIGVDWDLINQAAADWARAHTKDLVEGMQETSYEQARVAVADFYEQGWTMEDLETRLLRTYGPKRVETSRSRR